MKPSITEVMTAKLETVHPTNSMADAFQRMSKFRHLPVVDDKNSVVGIISDRDFQRARLAMDGEPSLVKFKEGSVVSQFMSSPVTTVDFHTPLSQVVETMITQKISAVLVTGEHNLVGIITSEDLLTVLADLLREKKSLQELLTQKIEDWTYHSPIGPIANLFANAGI